MEAEVGKRAIKAKVVKNWALVARKPLHYLGNSLQGGKDGTTPVGVWGNHEIESVVHTYNSYLAYFQMDISVELRSSDLSEWYNCMKIFLLFEYVFVFLFIE